MTNRRKRMFIGVLLLLVLTLGLIWGHSAESWEDSHERSMKIADSISGPVIRLFGLEIESEYLLRKGAHFAEFALLGCELALLMLLRQRSSLQDLINCLFCGLLAAVIDESIQILSDRGSSLKDVLLDFSGVIAGSLLLFCLFEAAAKRRAAGTGEGD